MRRYNLQSLFGKRKTLYLSLGIMLISVLSLTVVYAALSQVLNISGSTEIAASNWDIYLDNVIVRTGSVSANAPSISGNNNLSFTANLKTPGDYYEFSVDVVNDGTIDAMIDSIVKTPELTEEQSKFFKFEATYQNGDPIATKQTLKTKTRTPLIVRVEFRKDLTAADLPKTTTSLNLKLTLVYVQSDGTGSEISNNGVATNLKKPACTLSVLGSKYNGWYNTTPTITINTTPGYSKITDYIITTNQATDLNSINYDNILNKKQTTDTPGTTWYGYAKDEMGNVAQCSTNIKVDTTAPSIPTTGKITISGSSAAATLASASGSTDKTSNILEYRYAILNTSTKPSKTSTVFSTNRSFTRSCGQRYYAYAIAIDKAGNKSDVYAMGYAEDGANAYSGWSTCTKSCGGGTQTRTNTCALITTGLAQSCNSQDCCSQVKYGSWSEPTACSVSCGGGTQTQTRAKTSMYDGRSCGTETQTLNCNTHSCCSQTYSSGGYWTGCTVSCGGGTQDYYSKLYSSYDDSSCGTIKTTSQSCNTHACCQSPVYYTEYGGSSLACTKFAAQNMGGSANYTNGKLFVCTTSAATKCVVASATTCGKLGGTYFYFYYCP